MLFSDEEEKEAPFGVKPVDEKVEGAKEPSELGSTRVAEESEKVDFFVCVHSDMFLMSCKTQTHIHTQMHTPLPFSTTENKWLIC